MNAELITSVSALAERLGWAVLHSLWQGLVITAVVAIFLRVVRGAAARHLACVAAMALLLGWMALTAVRLNPSPRATAASPGGHFVHVAAPGAATVAAAEIPRPVVADAITREEPRSTIAQPAWREWARPLLPWISGCWVAGVALLSVWRLVGWHRVRALRRKGVSAAPGAVNETLLRLASRLRWQRVPRVLVSSRAAAPLLAGVLKPVVLLPGWLVTGLRPRELEAVLAHELAHFARGDAWANASQVLAETVLFYHPAMWWLGRRARIEREDAADDLAVRLLDEDRLRYAHALGKLAELEHASGSLALAMTDGSVIARIRRLIAAPRKADSPAVAWVLALALVGGAAALWPLRAQDAPPKAEKAAAQVDIETEHKRWLDDAFQLDDPAKRDLAIEQIRAAMASDDPARARAGVQAFCGLAAIEFDKAAVRPIVRKLLDATDAPTRAAAASALTVTGAEPQDLTRVFAMADDPAPEVRNGLASTITKLTKGDLTGKPASDAILKLMVNPPREPRDLFYVAHAIWGARFSPEIEARVLEFCRDVDGSPGYPFFYGALSTQGNKSEASCERLVELLAHREVGNIAGRAAWGLQQGVAPPQHALVAGGMLKVLTARSHAPLLLDALRCLQMYGSAEHLPPLRTLIAKPAITADYRKALEETVAAIEKRAPSPAAKPEPAAASAAPAATPQSDAAQLVEQNRQAARRRASKDRELYTAEQLEEIESLYQVANRKGKRTEEARKSLEELLQRYPNSNRTGCATLYLGQASEGDERLKYLTRAVEKFSDCYYFNGCQVGGYGRFVLALTLWERGEKDKARKLLDELKTTYRTATDHRGRPMGETADALEKHFDAQP